LCDVKATVTRLCSRSVFLWKFRASRGACCGLPSCLRLGETDARCKLAHTLHLPSATPPLSDSDTLHPWRYRVSVSTFKNSPQKLTKNVVQTLKKTAGLRFCLSSGKYLVNFLFLHCQAGPVRRRLSTHGAAFCPAKSSSSTAIPFVHQRHVYQVPARRYLLRCNRVSVSRSSTYCRRGHHLRLQQHLQLVYLAVRHNHQPADAFDFGRYPRVQFHSPPPLLCSNASRRRLYSVYASLVPHDASSSDARYVFYATDVSNAAFLGVLNLSSLQLSVRKVPQLSDWTEMACDSSTYANFQNHVCE
jgi:hypothetical protein